MTEYRCPVCGEPLRAQQEGKSLFCRNRHCFDRAKSGYVNLLPANQAHSKAPGDNKLMVDGRSAFLNKGYYEPLRDALCTAVLREAGTRKAVPFRLLDAGCGEGYYTAGIVDALDTAGIAAEIYGVDISKIALNTAAKRTKRADFAVASVFHLPLADNSCDLLLETFAPFCREEFFRVVKPGGGMLLVIPGRDHLFELKQAVYAHPYENETKPYPVEGFTFLGKSAVRTAISLRSGEDIRSLFTMTPYYYKTSREDTGRLLALSNLTTTISFEILAYRK